MSALTITALGPSLTTLGQTSSPSLEAPTLWATAPRTVRPIHPSPTSIPILTFQWYAEGSLSLWHLSDNAPHFELAHSTIHATHADHMVGRGIFAPVTQYFSKSKTKAIYHKARCHCRA
jgi:hypothetical protein